MNTAENKNTAFNQGLHSNFVEKQVEYWREKGYDVELLHDEIILEPKNIICDDFSMKMYQICKNCQSYKQENPFPEYNDCETHKIKVSDYGTCPDFKIKSAK